MKKTSVEPKLQNTTGQKNVAILAEQPSGLKWLSTFQHLITVHEISESVCWLASCLLLRKLSHPHAHAHVRAHTHNAIMWTKCLVNRTYRILSFHYFYEEKWARISVGWEMSQRTCNSSVKGILSSSKLWLIGGWKLITILFANEQWKNWKIMFPCSFHATSWWSIT